MKETKQKYTVKQINDLAGKILASLDREKIRGFHRWQFSGSVALSDTKLLIATTTEDLGFIVEVRYFTEEPPRFRYQIEEETLQTSTDAMTKAELVEAISRLLREDAER